MAPWATLAEVPLAKPLTTKERAAAAARGGAAQRWHRIGDAVGAVDVVGAVQAEGGGIEGLHAQVGAGTEQHGGLGTEIAAEAVASEAQPPSRGRQGLQLALGPGGHRLDQAGSFVGGQARGIGILGL